MSGDLGTTRQGPCCTLKCQVLSGLSVAPAGGWWGRGGVPLSPQTLDQADTCLCVSSSLTSRGWGDGVHLHLGLRRGLQPFWVRTEPWFLPSAMRLQGDPLQQQRVRGAGLALLGPRVRVWPCVSPRSGLWGGGCSSLLPTSHLMWGVSLLPSSLFPGTVQ